MMGEPPDNLEEVGCRARTFPKSWRDAAIRALYDDERGGVLCPRCKGLFRGRRELSQLHADHIIAWSRGGLTTWQNLQILCGPCNLAKHDSGSELPSS
jgi:5-methylcytosine-specific restriction endonuclease McrA